MRTWRDSIGIFFDNYGKYVYITGGLLLLLFFIWVAVSDGKVDSNKPKMGVLEEYDVTIKKADEVSHIFSEFSSYQIAPSNQYVAYEVNLYLKQPFISESDFKKAVNQYIELLKWKVNDKKTDTHLVGIRINVYDREIVYREDLPPRATVRYMLATEDKKKKKKDDKYLSGTDMRWEHTITQTKEPDYTKYKTVIAFERMKYTLGVVPLSDEEFEFYMKLDKYSALRGGNVQGGANLYLQWDLGRDITKDGLNRITKEFSDFQDRHVSLGGRKNYYTNSIKLKEELAVENPRFLVYALTKEIIDDRTLAKRRLIKIDSKFYLNVYLRDAKQKLRDGDTDTTSQEAIDAGELTDDEFETMSSDKDWVKEYLDTEHSDLQEETGMEDEIPRGTEGKVTEKEKNSGNDTVGEVKQNEEGNEEVSSDGETAPNVDTIEDGEDEDGHNWDVEVDEEAGF